MNANVSSTWMMHSGGTKYYQVFEILPAAINGQPVTIVHYGPVRNHLAPSPEDYRPVKGGQLQLIRGIHLGAKVDAKKKRGYRVDDTVIGKHVNLGPSFDRGDNWLIETFGAAYAHQIHLLVTTGQLASDAGGLDPAIKPDNEIVHGAKPVIEDRPASWGSW